MAQEFVGLARPAITDGSIRLAMPEDAQAVRALDDISFPLAVPYFQRAAPGELELAVRNGEVRVLEIDDKPVAYLHALRDIPGQIYIEGVAVDPRCQRRGLGTRLMRSCLEELTEAERLTTPIVTLTSPLNHRMLRLLFSHGFAGRWILRDFFGSGRDRVACQLAGPCWPPPVRHAVPAAELSVLYDLVETGEHVVSGLRRTLRSGSVFELGLSADVDLLPACPPGPTTA